MCLVHGQESGLQKAEWRIGMSFQIIENRGSDLHRRSSIFEEGEQTRRPQ